MTGLFASKKLRLRSTVPHRASSGTTRGAATLPNVVFVDPDYTDARRVQRHVERLPPHTAASQVAEGFVAQVHDALKEQPAVGPHGVHLNFDESGGFFDHVPPPPCQDDYGAARPRTLDPNLKRLGFRVPAIAMGPFAPKKIETDGPYEHCSILKMIEWRWDLEPMTLRDRTAKNLADALEFRFGRAPVTLPAFMAPPPVVC